MIETATGPVATEMTRRLVAALGPSAMTLVDESDHHIGHAGHDGRGESHFRLEIEAQAFTGKTRVQRQRLVYQALGDLMHDRVHALGMTTFAPGERD